MRLDHRHLAALLLVTLAACDKDATSPRQESVGPSVRGTGGAVFTQPNDTTGRVLAGPAVIHGDVTLMHVIQSGGGGVDTSQTSPLAGARLALSQGTTVLARVVAGVDGTFAFDVVPAGNYVLLAEGPAGSSVYPATAYISTTAAEISVNFRLVARP